jgi:polysaccharide biosynthesis protein PelF
MEDPSHTVDVVVLTSVSEGQPLVILEANGAGIPVVATEVGTCRELLTGLTPEDQALGPSGLLTPAASPQETAHALIQRWRDQERRHQMSRAGQERVRRFYHQDTLYAAYRGLYQQYLAASPSREEQ